MERMVGKLCLLELLGGIKLFFHVSGLEKEAFEFILGSFVMI